MALFTSLTGCVGCVAGCGSLASLNIVSKSDARKLLHTCEELLTVELTPAADLGLALVPSALCC